MRVVGVQGWGAEGTGGVGAETTGRGEAEAVDEVGARQGGGLQQMGSAARGSGQGQPRGGPGVGGGWYLKFGGDARCSPRKGEEAGGDAAPFSRSAIPWLSPCRRRAGEREGGREEGRGMLAVLAGRDIPAAGEGAGGRSPGAPSCGPGDSCRTDAATAGGDNLHPVPSRTARALGNAGPDGADVSAAGSPPPPHPQLCLQLETAPPRADVPQVAAAAPEPSVRGAAGVSPRPREATPGAGPAGRQLPRTRGRTHRATCQGLCSRDMPGGSGGSS